MPERMTTPADVSEAVMLVRTSSACVPSETTRRLALNAYRDALV